MVSDFPLNLDPAAFPQRPIPEPTEIRAGDTVTWQREWDSYPPGAGYILSYMLVGLAAGYAVSGSMVTAGENNYVVKIPAATTATWTTGNYRWQAYISDADGNRYTVAEGVVEILPNLQTATSGLDDREPDEIILANILAMLQNKATTDVRTYELAGRRLEHYTWDELQRARSTYEKRVRKIRIRRGEKPPTQSIGVVFRNGY